MKDYEILESDKGIKKDKHFSKWLYYDSKGVRCYQSFKLYQAVGSEILTILLLRGEYLLMQRVGVIYFTKKGLITLDKFDINIWWFRYDLFWIGGIKYKKRLRKNEEKNNCLWLLFLSITNRRKKENWVF